MHAWPFVIFLRHGRKCKSGPSAPLPAQIARNLQAPEARRACLEARRHQAGMCRAPVWPSRVRVHRPSAMRHARILPSYEALKSEPAPMASAQTWRAGANFPPQGKRKQSWEQGRQAAPVRRCPFAESVHLPARSFRRTVNTGLDRKNASPLLSKRSIAKRQRRELSRRPNKSSRTGIRK